MICKKYIVPLILLYFVLICSNSYGQNNVYPNPVYVNEDVEIVIKLPGSVQQANSSKVNTQYNYRVIASGVEIVAQQKDSDPDILIIEEGKKEPYTTHRFYIFYKKDIRLEETMYDFSNTKKLKEHDIAFAAYKPKAVNPVVQQSVQIKSEEKKENQNSVINNPETEYYKLISDGDKDFKREAWEEAKKKFELASKLRPDEEYSKSKLTIIKIKLDDLARQKQIQINSEYNTLIVEGIELRKQKNYIKAKEKFEQAKNTKPDDSGNAALLIESTNKLMRDEEYQKEQSEKNSKYQYYISEGDKANEKNSYPEAKAYYSQALIVKEGDLQAEQKINFVTNKIKEQKDREELQKKYNQLFSLAEMFYKAEDLDNAKNSYEEANSYIKTPEITDRIKEINKRIRDKELQALNEKERIEKKTKDEEKYLAIIEKADLEFRNENYTQAKKMYAQALAIKPEESFPNERLTAIENKISEKKNLDKLQKDKEENDLQKELQYKAAINTGKKFYDKGDWQNAKEAYDNARILKPNENEPQQQLVAINKQLETLRIENENIEKFESKLSIANSIFINYTIKEQTKEAFDSALLFYKEAAQINSSDYYVNSQIKYIKSEINRIEKELAIQKEKRRIIVRDSTYFFLKKEIWKIYKEKKYQETMNAINQFLNIVKYDSMPPDNDISVIIPILQNQLSKSSISNNNLISSNTAAKDEQANLPLKNDSNSITDEKPKIEDKAKLPITEKSVAIVKDTFFAVKESPQIVDFTKIAEKQHEQVPYKTYTLQIKPIPYYTDLPKKYPDIDFAKLPPEMRLNVAGDSKNNSVESAKMVEEKYDLNLMVSENNVNMICQGISFKESNIYLKFLIQNGSTSEFLTGAMILNWNQQSGKRVSMLPTYIHPQYLPMIMPGNEAFIIFVTTVNEYVTDTESLNFELTDRLKKIKLQLSIPGAIYNKAINR